jgi:hypothetical protein
VITWQDATTAGIVLVALTYTARHIVRAIRRRGSPGCSCCSQCPAESDEKPLVKVDEPKEIEADLPEK